VLWAVIFALSNAGCSPVYEIEVHNTAAVPLMFGQTAIPCEVSDEEILRLTSLDRLEPGEERVLVTEYDNNCLVVRTADGSRLAKVPFRTEVRYQISAPGGMPAVTVIDRQDEETNWVMTIGTIVASLAFLVGMMWIFWTADIPPLRGFKARIRRRLARAP